jgi:hypothetical protein
MVGVAAAHPTTTTGTTISTTMRAMGTSLMHICHKDENAVKLPAEVSRRWGLNPKFSERYLTGCVHFLNFDRVMVYVMMIIVVTVINMHHIDDDRNGRAGGMWCPSSM